MNIAENIKKARKDRGLKQADFAMLIGVARKMSAGGKMAK